MLLNMRDLLSVAKKYQFAVPAFNIGSGFILNAVLERCELLRAPVILAVHPLELAFNKDSFVAQCLNAAHNASIPVTVHLDHGATLEQILHAIRLGFTSVMMDASSKPYEENVRICRDVVNIAHPFNISVEGELGTVGSTGTSGEGGAEEITYTQPDQASEFVKRTGVDALAIAIGTAHGIYPENFIPKLHLELLKEIKEKVDVPLVLHGGSANPDSEIAKSVDWGINKINISSDIKSAFYQQLRQDLNNSPKQYESYRLYQNGIIAIKEVVDCKLNLFKAVDKSKHYHL